jgi:hypothetical protein
MYFDMTKFTALIVVITSVNIAADTLTCRKTPTPENRGIPYN